ncbi:MAG: hypothetical protein JKY95_15385 [Planctomycetaceae bacterium]|nr:hypothetical protein [Planctomycetaceae bacterium]
MDSFAYRLIASASAWLLNVNNSGDEDCRSDQQDVVIGITFLERPEMSAVTAKRRKSVLKSFDMASS